MSEAETIRFEDDPNRKGGFGLRPGQIVGAGRYHLVKLLGQGGGGSVWRSFDTRLSVEVALKFIPRQVQRDPRAFARLREEVLHSRNLSHPHIVKVFDLEMYGEEDPFISMELVVGRNLSQLLAQQTQQVFAWSYLRPILAQLCSALSYAHRERVVHCDLKPANLMMNEDGELKLTDFGISRQMSETETRLEIRREISGTLLYMSPQQLEGKKAKPSDDIYSLGATLYELLAGTPPFHRGEILHQILSVEPDPLQQRLAERDVVNPIPTHVRETIARCLSKMPRGRPASVEELAEALDLTTGSDSRHGRGERLVPLSEAPPVVPEEPRVVRETVAQNPAWTEEPAPVKPSGGWGKVVGILAVLLVAGLGAIYQWHPEWLRSKAKETTDGNGDGTNGTPQLPVDPPQPNPWLLSEQDLAGLPQLFKRLQAPKTDLDSWFQAHLSEETRSALPSYSGSGTPPSTLSALVRRDLNGLILGPTLYDVQRFVRVELRPETHALAASALGKDPQIKEEIQHLNRLLVEDTFSGGETVVETPPTPTPPPKPPDPALVTFQASVKSARFELTSKETGAKLLLTNQITAYVTPGKYRVAGTSLSWDKIPLEIDNFEVRAGATVTIQIATVKVDSSPSGAQLYEGDRPLGPTPKTFPVQLNEACKLRFELPGYYAKTITERFSQLDVRLGSVELQRAPHPTAGPYTNALGMVFAQVDLPEGAVPSAWFGTTELRKSSYARFFHQEWNAFRQKNLTLNLPEKLSRAWMTSPREGELGADADDPVVSVSWQDAKLFCLWLTAFEHDREHPLPADWEYRLPTDWEWGVAAGLVGEKWDATPRARSEDPTFADKFPWGGRLPPPKGFANYNGTTYDSHPTIAPVQAYGANALGLFNMHGNMSEWCEDIYDPSADATVTSTVNREASNVIRSSKGKRERTVRGGSWRSDPNEQMRSNYRQSFPETEERPNVGFRIVLSRKGPR